MKRKQKLGPKSRLVIVTIVIIFIALILETALLEEITKKSAYRTAEYIRDEVISVIHTKEDKDTVSSDLVNKMAVFKGVNIYIVDLATDNICGTNVENAEGKKLLDVGISELEQDKSGHIRGMYHNNGIRVFYVYEKHEEYGICVTYTSMAQFNNFLVYMGVEVFYLLIAAIIVYKLASKALKANEERNEQYQIMKSMSEIYFSMHLIDLEKDSAFEYNSEDKLREVVNRYESANEQMKRVIEGVITEEDRERAQIFTDLSTISVRLQDKKIVSEVFHSNRIGWFRAVFISVDRDSDGKTRQVIFATQDVDAEIRREQDLIAKSTTDELSGCYNRRAYEEELSTLGNKDNFLYISMDLNGLKQTNDSLGHAAGDEIIVGAAECMQQAFGMYGKVFRTGGDEFIAILRAKASEEPMIKEEFDRVISIWRGQLVDRISVSYGCVASSEIAWKDILEIAVLADQRMYKDKANYYKQSGIDRRCVHGDDA